MVKKHSEKKKAKRKAKQKAQRSAKQTGQRLEKAEYLFYEAQLCTDHQNFDKALHFLRKALKINPRDVDYLTYLGHLGREMEDADLELEALLSLHRYGALEDRFLPHFIDLLTEKKNYGLAVEISDLLLERLPKTDLTEKRRIRAAVKQNKAYCLGRIDFQSRMEQLRRESKHRADSRPKVSATKRKPEKPADKPSAGAVAKPAVHRPSLPAIPVNFVIDQDSFQEGLSARETSTRQQYEVALDALGIRLKDSFENLICLADLKDIRSFWYQEETARKVLKIFRGRALLADEVGLGKTIEASMVLKEYIRRGMVKNALILTPSPLVSQWKEELESKFGLNFISTDDSDFRKNEPEVWGQPYILASINQAKSKRNFATVTGREYDMVIVDEAHHLKNRTTLNWKLVNALKKRFLLLLTATPVENNLMELYNLITLLKPGQLKTASAFREEFMTRGDPTSPQNRVRLKALLGQVMIRNTRALAKLNIPPRFAETIRVAPTDGEKELYEGISRLAAAINQSNGGRNKLLLKNLLAEAGSSPKAVDLTLERMQAKEEISAVHRKQIDAVRKLSRALSETQKNKILLKLIRSSPAKKIIFVTYLGTLDHVTDFLDRQKIPHATFHGRMSNQAKDEEIRRFQEEKDILVTTEIGGEGRNLQFCHQMINYDLPWNPMKIEQRIGRLHRIGQEKEVQIYNLCAADSIEDYILDILDRKINMFEMVIGEIDMVLGRIRGEKDFSDQVYDIWLQAASAEDRRKGFARLGTQLKRFKTQYETTKTLDEKLFGENYEL